jgi:hypothetical protein
MFANVLINIFKTLFVAGCQWHLSVILATWETEIRKNVVQSHCRQNVNETIFQAIAEHGDMCRLSQLGGKLLLGGCGSRLIQGKKVIESPFQQKKKMSMLTQACHLNNSRKNKMWQFIWSW